MVLFLLVAALLVGSGEVCPVAGPVEFSDTFGLESKGRIHQGQDLYAERGVPALAVEGGRVEFSTHPIGGNRVKLTTEDGWVFSYTHLDGFPEWLESGSEVAAGAIVGFVGNSGNAQCCSPHLHFSQLERGEYVNPWPWLVNACMGPADGGETEVAPEIVT
jgi:murein DD-endopeptidase MepM/ murein hydrolase activator NlpD